MVKKYKACLNVDCHGYGSKKKYTNLEKYCIFCGSTLQNVCSEKNCLKTVLEANEELCPEHKTIHEQKLKEQKDTIDKVAKTGVSLAASAVAVVTPFVKDIANEQILKVIEKAKNTFKK